MKTRLVDAQELEELGVQILGISTERSFSQRTFAQSLGLTFPLLSDYPDGEVTQLYSAGKFIKAGTDVTPFMVPGQSLIFNEDRLVASQAFFLIDKEGILRGRWLPGDIEPFSNDQILEMVRMLSDKP